MTLDGVKDWASSGTNLDKEVAPFAYAAAGCERRNAWPGAAFLFICEIGQRFGKKEGERYELRLPKKVMVHRRNMRRASAR